jgi:hypothetical protein
VLFDLRLAVAVLPMERQEIDLLGKSLSSQGGLAHFILYFLYISTTYGNRTNHASKNRTSYGSVTTLNMRVFAFLGLGI